MRYASSEKVKAMEDQEWAKGTEKGTENEEEWMEKEGALAHGAESQEAYNPGKNHRESLHRQKCHHQTRR